VPTVECGDGEEVHESKDERQGSRHVPEAFPFPGFTEHGTDAGEAAKAFGHLDVAFEHLTEGLELIAQEPHPLVITGGEGLDKTIVDAFGVVELGWAGGVDTDLRIFVGGEGNALNGLTTLGLYAEGDFGVLLSFDVGRKFIKVGDGASVDADDLIFYFQACFFGGKVVLPCSRAGSGCRPTYCRCLFFVRCHYG
jgi:hypothetical protein